jgi:hypothetical protein
MAHQYATAADTISDYMPEVILDATAVTGNKHIIDRHLQAVSAFIDEYCRRRLGYFLPAGSTATERRFRGKGKNYLELPVHVADTVVIEGIAGSVIYENDVNGWVYWNDINIDTGDYHYASGDRFFEEGRQYLVTAKWGYAETPAPIVAACKEIAASIWSKGNGIVGEISPEGFVIEREIPLTARAFLKPFIRREFEIQ